MIAMANTLDLPLTCRDIDCHAAVCLRQQNKLLTTPFGDPWWHDTMHYYDGSEMIDVPALHVSTWYDPSVLESIDSFNYFREHAVSETAAEHQ
jgi:predicted acyl esterase